MYGYFGVGPQVREDVDGIYPRFLYWLPKYHLSMPSKCSLEVFFMEFCIFRVFVIWLWFGPFFIMSSL